MKGRRFFIWLKGWLASLSRSAFQPLGGSSDWSERLEGAVPSYWLRLLGTLKKEGFSPSSPQGLREAEPPAARHLKAAKEEPPVREWIRKSQSLEAREMRRSPALKSRELVAPHRRPRLLVATPSRNLPHLHGKSMPTLQSPPRIRRQGLDSSILTSYRVRDTVSASSQRSALILLSRLEELTARGPTHAEPEATPQPTARKSEGRPYPHAGSSFWLHLGPRLAADFNPTDS